MTREPTTKSSVKQVVIGPEQAGRRLDNFLMGILKHVPKTRIYRMLRKGEIRVNSARVKQDYRILEQDIIRIPPVYQTLPQESGTTPKPAQLGQIQSSLIYEDEYLLVINKPAGIAVHAGSGEKFGVIEILRELRPDDRGLELVHRLDKPTSGCLMIARDHRILRMLHKMFQDGSQIRKQYIALLKGNLNEIRQVSLALRKNELRSGERMVQTDANGRKARTKLTPVSRINKSTLVRAEIATGRTHQIRVHAASIGHPIAGDEKYGDRTFNKSMKRAGLKRMFLHAEKLTLKLPHTGKNSTFTAPVPEDLEILLRNLAHEEK